MSDQVQDNTQEEEILEDVVADQEVEAVEIDDDNLDEAKKASMGDPSEIPDPTPVKAPVPKTKVGMIKAMMDFANKSKKMDVASMYTAMMDPKAKELSLIHI